MKLFLIIIFFFFLNNCSFDNKTGIWNEENNFKMEKESKKNEIFKNFQKISVSDEAFDKTIIFKNDLVLSFSEPVINYTWQEVFFNQNNNFKNFSYTDLNQITLNSKKLTKNKVKNYKLYENGNVIINDSKGNIIIFSITENKITKFNFYKKKFKNIKKELQFIVEDNII